MDPASVADPSKHRIIDGDFTFNVDFDAQNIVGTVEYTVECYENNKSMLLDVSKLHVKEVKVDNKRVDWSIKEHKYPSLGSILEVPVKNEGSTCKLTIDFMTGKECSGLQWIPAELTSDKKKTFLFSQCQSINARSIFPCQDTPAVKFSYTAKVHAPNDVNILLAAVRSSEPRECSDHAGCKIFEYRQSVPVPSYLFAIAGGEIVGKKIGPRSTVWTEPSLVVTAALEFDECEKMLAAAEELCGKYEWGVYDILVPPPTFPFGGMENPCLTYVTPMIIAGDKSLVNVLAHEIAHSWTGNLVTNNNWENFWLNEGHTDYLERLILEKLYGPEERQLHIAIGYEELRESVNSFGHDHEFTKLVPKLEGVHPDDSYSRVPYEKGSLLLYQLEQIYGRDKMMTWLKAYLKHFAGKSLGTAEWLDFLRENLAADVEKKLDFDAWLYKPGMPPMQPPKNQLILDVERACDLCQMGEKLISDSVLLAEFKSLYGGFDSKQKEFFFRLCWFLEKPLCHAVLDKIEEFFQCSTSKNARIRLGWSMICITGKHKRFNPSVFEFLNSQGVMKFVRPIYKGLRDWPEMKSEAVENFKKQRHLMYPCTSRLVAMDLGI